MEWAVEGKTYGDSDGSVHETEGSEPSSQGNVEAGPEREWSGGSYPPPGRLERYILQPWWSFRYRWFSLESWSDWYNYWPNQMLVWYTVAACCFAVAGVGFVFTVTG